MNRAWLCALLLAVPGLAAQTGGAVGGTVRDAASTQPVAGARVLLDDGRQFATTDATGAYRIREVRSGWHRVLVSAIGYRSARTDSVLVRSGATTNVDFRLQLAAVELDSSIVVEAVRDPVLDPLITADVQRIGGDEIRRLPITTLEEAVALSAGSVGESYRGGRLGQTTFIIDGLGVKNQLDASTGPLGVRVPPDLLTEASLTTNGFSARWGQAVSGMVNVVTKDGGESWLGRVAYETDRPFTGGGDLGIDRFVVAAEGPLPGRLGFAGVIDVEGRLDADPALAPPPTDPRDPRFSNPDMLPHNRGARLDVGAKLRIPVSRRQTLRLFGLRSVGQRLLYDAAYKYDLTLGPAQEVTGTLATAHLQHVGDRLTADFRLGYFGREFVRGALADAPEWVFGTFPSSSFHIQGEDLAREQDTLAAQAPLPGFITPEFSSRSPWGVPAFFLGDAPKGEVAWNRFNEVRALVDVVAGVRANIDLYGGAEVVTQRVQTFHRVLAYLPVDSGVPPAAISNFSPLMGAAYGEAHMRGEDFGITIGLRYDGFSPGTDLRGSSGARSSLNPRFAFSTVLKGATVVASWGRFAQTPDFQYLVDAAFDDTSRTGRFRRGNPNLGFERSTQYEFSVRGRPSRFTSVRVNVFQKELDGLVASVPITVDPDSTFFGNFDFGSVRGAELIFERELRDWWGFRVGYTLQDAVATATDAYELTRRIRVDSATGDTINPANVEFPLDYDRRHGLVAIAQLRVPEVVRYARGVELAAIFRYDSGLPYTRTNLTGDTLIGLPNSWRLPATHQLDLLLRVPVSVERWKGSLYLDVRNVLNRQNLVAVRRETGEPGLTQSALTAYAESAYVAHPEPIPFESPRYRAAADLDGNGRIEGRNELYPMFEAAASDYYQPIFAYGPPRLLRFGMELLF